MSDRDSGAEGADVPNLSEDFVSCGEDDNKEEASTAAEEADGVGKGQQDVMECQEMQPGSASPPVLEPVEKAGDSAANQENNDGVEDCINLYDEENFDEVNISCPVVRFPFYGHSVGPTGFCCKPASLEARLDDLF